MTEKQVSIQLTLTVREDEHGNLFMPGTISHDITIINLTCNDPAFTKTLYTSDKGQMSEKGFRMLFSALAFGAGGAAKMAIDALVTTPDLCIVTINKMVIEQLFRDKFSSGIYVNE